MKPIDWEHSTLDEVLLVVKGDLDRKRWERDLAYLVFCGSTSSKDRPTKYDVLPLRDDDQLNKSPDESLLEWHQMASKEMANFKWPNKN